MAESKKILILEADEVLQRLLDAVLRPDGFEALVSGDGEHAIQLLHQFAVAGCIVDVSLAPSTLESGARRGVGFLHYLERERPELLRRVIVLSGLSPRHVPRDLPSVCQFLSKPFDVEELRDALRACVALEVSSVR